MLRGMLDLPQPRLPVAGIVDNEIGAGVLAAWPAAPPGHGRTSIAIVSLSTS
jgi:hypothetical protein